VPLVFILNGYFRSGTTLLYKIIKESNKDKLVFYEPLHNDLFRLLKKHKIGVVDKVHKINLWDEYLIQGKDFIEKLKRYHPNINQIFPFDAEKVVKYLNVFHELKQDVILQPNRLHFVIEKVVKHYALPFVHMIRNPLDVYLSIINTYRKKRHKIVVFFADLLRKVNLLPLQKAFALDQGLDLIYKFYSKPSVWGDFSFRVRHFNDIFGIFLSNWTLSNYFAIKQLEKCNGFLLKYEDFVNNPVEYFESLERFSHIRFDKKLASTVSNKFTRKYDSRLLNKLKSKVEEYRIEDEWQYVIEKAGYVF